MGKIKVGFIVLLAGLSACGESNGNVVSSGCYSYEKNGDHVELSIVNSGVGIKGELDYSISGKDKNAGGITGFQQGEILLLDYRFQSEGTKSLRQVAFKIDGQRLVEGYGNMHEENGKLVFDNPRKLSFPKTVVLKKVSCD